jgi:glycosyltransferase involved in cell wall biosynthesis
VLGWDPERAVILMAAVDWQAPRKGGAIWLDAAARIRTPYDLALVGETRLPADLCGPGRVHALGGVGDDRLLALAYAAADLVVVPSLFDNLPNVLLESLACGTPCVGFATGGIPEAIVPGRTGGLAEAISGPALAACVEHWLGVVRADRAGWAARCVEFARAHYDPGQQARRHRELFEELARDTQ